MALKYIIRLFMLILIFVWMSCSDVTNISKEQIQDSAYSFDGSHSIFNGENQPLYVLNGKILSSDTQLRLKPEHIDSISVIKGKTALQEYGKKGQYGAIEIYADFKMVEDVKTDSLDQSDFLITRNITCEMSLL